MDEYKYYIPRQVIIDTERILSDFTLKGYPCEEIVYWAGIREANKITVLLVVAPDAEVSHGKAIVSHESNFHFIKTLSSKNYIQIAQVHSHPSSWIGHSFGDSKGLRICANTFSYS